VLRDGVGTQRHFAREVVFGFVALPESAAGEPILQSLSASFAESPDSAFVLEYNALVVTALRSALWVSRPKNRLPALAG